MKIKEMQKRVYENKIDKGEEWTSEDDDDFYYTEWVYRDNIPTENIKSIYKI